MNLVQEIQSQLTTLPSNLQAEVLDFIKIIKKKHNINEASTSLERPTRLEDVVGCIPYEGRAKTVEEMDAAVAEGFRREWQE